MSEIKDKPNAPDLSGLVDQMKGIDADTFHDALKEHLPDHYNKVFRTGYGTAKGEFAPKIEATSKSMEALKAEIEQREARIKELTEKTPDLGS